MSATESLQPLPGADDVAWVDELVAAGLLKLTELVERLEAGSVVRDFDGELRTRVELEPLSLEHLARLLLLARSVRQLTKTLGDDANRMERVALELWYRHEDAHQGVVSSVAGVESYLANRRRAAERFRKAAESEAAHVARIASAGGSDA
jgi:hypothetical protein